MLPTLQKKYEDEIVKVVKEKFAIKNVMAIPRLQKVVINMGVGKAIGDMKVLDSAVKDLTKIAGQKPLITKSKVAISNFKLREDLPIGCKVTLRRTRMYEFIDRFVNTTLPRIRDFNGVSNKSFDKRGNFSVGIVEQAIFPEIDPGKLAHPQGMDITFVFNRGPKEQTQEILRLLGMPFAKR